MKQWALGEKLSVATGMSPAGPTRSRLVTPEPRGDRSLPTCPLHNASRCEDTAPRAPGLKSSRFVVT